MQNGWNCPLSQFRPTTFALEWLENGRPRPFVAGERQM